ncbi:MAG TPA: N-6 DNA methylase [Pirellulales bacterium]|nr:N-6 DNA methylase [Pirellulales bacterium]
MTAPPLRQLDFITAGGKPIPGLVAVKGGLNSVDRLEERVAMQEAEAIRGVDYVFFRRFTDGRSSQVVAYVVDNAKERSSESDLAQLHKRVWLHGGVPLIYVAWATKVDVLSCARGPDFWGNDGCKYNPADEIRFLTQQAADVDAALRKQRGRYSAWRLADGTFWDDPQNAALARSEQRAHEALIQAVVETDQELDGERQPLLRRLLLLTVLIKYLEDRRVFPSGWFGGFSAGARSFRDALRDGEPSEIERLLKNLERRFNGDIFVLPEGAGSTLTRSVLGRFARLVEAKTLGQQRYLWEQFSFEHIPVEIVSHLYQRFVQGGHGTVYTPPFLASLLLDHAMPYDVLTGKERILDPACGSAVFLVGAYRRLVHVWRSQHGWKRPNVATLKAILKQSIFGIELEAGATELAAFSLALAVCDALKPEVIWSDLKFEPFRDANLLEGDFFDEVREARLGKAIICTAPFDIILGNPPFESELTEPGSELNREQEASRGGLPDQQAAYLFLEQAIGQLKPGGRLCLVQPSGVLYNRKAASFRSRIFRETTVESVLDFTSIRNLFLAADTKAVAFLVRRDLPAGDHQVAHLTFRRTFGTSQRIAFEIDHYDWHQVSQQAAVEDDLAWRINLLGGGRLAGISGRLRQMRTLDTFVREQGWDYGEGFIAAAKGPREPAPFLTGKPLLPTEAFSDDGIDEDEITNVTATHFRSAYTMERYTAPLVLIKEHESLPAVLWEKGFLAYRAKIVGIHADPSERAALAAFFKVFQARRRLYQFCCALNGSQALVGKATAVLKHDIDAIPFPEDQSDLQLSFWEEAIQDDILDYMRDFVRLGQNSKLLKDAARDEDLRSFADMFCRMLGSVYDNLRADAPVFLDGLICQPFFFGERPDVSWFAGPDRESLRQLIHYQHHESLQTVRMLRVYANNVVLIVKPDRLRFWIRSTAIQDADETMVDLLEQGY